MNVTVTQFLELMFIVSLIFSQFWFSDYSFHNPGSVTWVHSEASEYHTVYSYGLEIHKTLTCINVQGDFVDSF